MRRTAFTLVELVVTITMAVVIFAAALMVFGFANRSRGATATARALQTALLIQEHMTTDLGRLVQAGEAPLSVPPGDPARMSFYAYDPALGKGKSMHVRGIVYRLAKAGAMLTRECNGPPESIGTAPLAALAFSPFQCATGPYVRVTLTVGREDGEPQGPPTVHSFLVPVNVTSRAGLLNFPVVSAFRDPSVDEPTSRDLPDL